MRCVPLLVETFGGLSPPLVDALRRCDVLRAAAEWRKNKLTASEYEETTWSARMAFVTRRSVFPLRRSCRWRRRRRRALGLSVAADPRAQ